MPTVQSAEPLDDAPLAPSTPKRVVKAVPVEPGEAIKRRRGRPPKAKVQEIVHLPRPKNYRMKPPEFFQYWKRIHKDFADRLTVYVYRLWPVIDRSLTGHSHNVEKLVEPLDPKNWEHEILHRWGSGDYKFLLKDAGLNKTVGQTVVKPLRDPEYPPAVKLDELVMDEPANRSYIENLKLRGLLRPGENEEDGDMGMGAGSNQAVEALTSTVENLTDKVVEMASQQQQQPPPAAVSPASAIDEQAVSHGLGILRQATEMGNRIVEGAINRAGNPVEMITAVVGLVEKMQEGKAAAPAANPAVDALLERLAKADERAWEANNKRIEFAEKVALEAAAKPAATPAQPQTQQQQQQTSPMEQFREFLKIRREFEEEVGPPARSGGSGLLERLPDIVKSVSLGLAGLASITHNITVLRAGAGAAAPPPPPEMAQELTNPAMGELPGGETVTATTQAQNEIEYLLGLMNRVRGPLLRFINDGRSGEDFANLIIDMEDNGLIVHERLRQLGKEQILMLLQADKALWQHLAGIPSRVSQFLDEFVGYDPNAEEEPAAPAPRRKVVAVKSNSGPQPPANPPAA